MASGIQSRGFKRNSQTHGQPTVAKTPVISQNGSTTLQPGRMIEIDVGGNLLLSIYQSDILQDDADGIVNPTDRRLNLKGSEGGKAILHAGGSQILDECNNYVLKHGNVEVTDSVAETSAGKLKAKTLIHCCCPDFRKDCNGNNDMGLNMMQVTYGLCLERAKKSDLTSLAFPSLGADEHGFPPQLSAAAAAQALIDAFFSGDLGSLRQIRFIISNLATAQKFVEEFTKATELLPSAVIHETAAPHFITPGPSSSSQTSDSTQSSSTSKSAESSEESEDGSGYDDYFDAMMSDTNLRNGPLTRRQKRLGDGSEIAEKKPKEEDRGESSSTASAAGEEEDPSCSICMCEYEETKTEKTRHLEKCGHKFHADCIKQAWLKMSPQCPICKTWYGVPKGDMPHGATMTHHVQPGPVPGFTCNSHIAIHYSVPGGIQGGEHPRPGHRFHGTSRTAFLPNTEEGIDALKLLKLSFKYRLTFTVGDSHTSGMKDVVVWNCIHHKTSLGGGPQCYGYPDEHYLKRLEQELASVGITRELLTREEAEFGPLDVPGRGRKR